MVIHEISDKEQIRRLLADDPALTLEALDENLLGVQGIVSVFAAEEQAPVNQMIVRWGQRHLGLGSVALLRAGRLTGLEDVVAALPADRGLYDVALPFWASPAITASFNAQAIGAEALYAVDRPRLVRAPSARQCTRLDDLEIIRPMFPKLAADAPAYVLALRGALVAVAAVTHLRDDIARLSVYVVEEARRRGFGRGVLTALAEELLALAVLPTIVVDLGQEAAVRLVEGAGFFQRAAHLRARVQGRRAVEPQAPAQGPLVVLGGPR